MDRTFIAAATVFAALAAAGIGLSLFPTSVVADVGAIRALGPSLFAAGLAAFLVEAFRWDRQRTRR